MIIAPAGYGKTTAVAQWASTVPHAVAWIDASTGTPAPNLADDILDGLMSAMPAAESPGRATSSYSSVEACIAAIDFPLIVVIDGLSSPVDDETIRILGAMAERLPDAVRMVVISRSHLPLPIARLRAEGAVAEIRQEALAFTIGEAKELLCDTLRLNLSADQLATLTARTEGWPAGLRLAALTLRESRDPAISVEAFNGTNRYVQSYLIDEVFSKQPAHLQNFLMKTSMVSPFDAGLAAALTGGGDEARRSIQCLICDNVFIVPVDDSHRWYRYHHLFADVVRFRHEREKPDEIAALHRIACRWLTENNRPQDATRHAIELRDWDLAVSLLEPLGGPAAVQFQAVVAWIQTLPDDAVRAQPSLSLWSAWAELQAGHTRAAERAIDLADQVWKSRSDTSHRGEVLFLRSRVARCRAEGRLSVSLGEQALANLGDRETSLRALAYISISRGYMIEGLPVDAEVAARDAYGIAHDAMEPNEEVMGMAIAHMGRAQASQGRLSDAWNTYQHAVAVYGRRPAGVPIHITLYLAESQIDRNELDEATTLLGEATLRVRQETMSVLKPDLWLQRARLSFAQGNSEAALSTVDHLLSWSRRHGSRVSVATAEALRARIWLKEGDYKKTQAWLDRSCLDDDADVSHEQEAAYFVLARFLLHEFRTFGRLTAADKALRILRRLGAEALKNKRPLDAAQAMLLGGITRQERGDTAKAMSHLDRALDITLPERALRLLLDEGEDLLRLAHLAREAGRGHGHVEELIAAFDAQGADPPHASEPTDPRIVELSTREQEILRFVASGLTNQEIADRMFISVNTVKTHLKHIFAKVGAASRAQAIARAFGLGIL